MKNVIGYICLGIIVLFVLISIVDSAYTLDEEHSAVITTWGNPQLVTEPGFHFKVPFVQHKFEVDTTIQGLPIGYVVDTNENIASESVMISSDYNFINVDFWIEYVISDPIKATYSSSDYQNILKSASQNCIRTVIASYPVDAILTTGKSEIQVNILTMLIEKIDEFDIGITVRSVTIQDSEPPTSEVSNAFKAVETAKQNKQTKINEANKYRNENLPAAEAEANGIVQSAEATKAARILEAEGQVARFNAMYEEYQKFPYVTRQRMFYEAMESVLPNLKIIIQGADGAVDTVLPLDSFTGVSQSRSSSTASLSQSVNADTNAQED